MKHETDELLNIMRRLRDPEQGCPWDLKQDFASIAPYTIEEAYEVVDVIERGDMKHLPEELGDLLLQVVFHSQIAQEAGLFTYADVVTAINEKLVRRHPGVFSDAEIETAEAQSDSWDRIKSEERAQQGAQSMLDGIPRGMAELQRSVKLQAKAGKAGFEWPTAEPIVEKFEEELEELRDALRSGDRSELLDEIGDLLFVTANLARQVSLDPAAALRHANEKFERRFRAMEEAAGGSEALSSLDLEQMEQLWQDIKRGASERTEND